MTKELFDAGRIKSLFPIFKEKVCGEPLNYLDNAATSQKPRSVIERIHTFYSIQNSNVHRGVYQLSELASVEYEKARDKIVQFIGATKREEVIFTRGTTESINLVASSWGRSQIKPGDRIVVTRMEHHSNFVPWQSLAREVGAEFKIVELTSDCRIDLKTFESALNSRTKIVALPQMSNATGVINPITELTSIAKKVGARVLVDAAQSTPHLLVDLTKLGDIDFLCFSGHKTFGPTGIGVLWGKEELLNEMPPYQFGGDMIESVEDDSTTWNALPWKFEAGTPNIAGVIGLGAAVDFLERYDRTDIHNHESRLGSYLLEKLLLEPGIRVLGPQDPEMKGPVVSFELDGVHSHDLATYIDRFGICIRAGHHCAQPLLRKFGFQSTSRVSAAFYNTQDDIDRFLDGISKARKYFHGK